MCFKMAARPSSPEVPLQAAHLSLSCSSCGDEVEEVKCLPCLHSLPLCDKATCHQKALQRGVTCQQCQEVFPVPSGRFPPHPFAGRKAVSKQCEEKEVFCHEDHDEPQKAVAYCSQCPGPVCEECVQAHRSMKIFKTHSTVPLSKAVSEGSIIKKLAFVCENHKEKQRLYCMECETLICALCHSVGDHKSHSVLFVDDEVGEKNKSTLKSCIASAKRSIDKVTGALGQVERRMDVMHQQSEDAKVHITELTDHFIAILRARQDVLVGEVDQLEERASRELQSHKEKLNEKLLELKQFALLTEDLLQHGIPKEQISLKKSVVQRIATITATPFPAPPSVCNVHFDSTAVKERFEEELSQLSSLTGGVSPQNCTVEDLPAPVLVVDGVLPIWSIPLTFAVVTCDKDSKPCRGVDRVLATLSPSTCGVSVVGRVEDRGEGTYQVQFNTLSAPHCQLSVIVNGGHVRGSPLMVRKVTGKVVKVYSGVGRAFRVLTVGSDDVLFATDSINGEVCVFNQTGDLVRHFQLEEPGGCIDGIAEMPAGNISVSCYFKNCIKVYTPNGQLVQQFDLSHHVDGPSGLAVNSKGQLFIVGYRDHRVSVFNQSGAFQYSFGSSGNNPGQLDSPDQICIAPDGLVYVTDWGNNRVQVFELDGKFVRQFGEDVLKSPTGIAVTKDGLVVVASQGADKLSIFTLQGQCVHEVTDIGLENPFDVAVDTCGWVYVIDCRHRILKLIVTQITNFA